MTCIPEHANAVQLIQYIEITLGLKDPRAIRKLLLLAIHMIEEELRPKP